MQKTLYYVHDPMCSWCWGFRKTWEVVVKELSDSITLVSLLGGLAADSDQTMPTEMQTMIHNTWKTIQQRIPGTRFNFDFWDKCTPRRSTYPACRAVIAARNQRKSSEQAMILAIQQAYYLNALNPSDDSVLIQLARTLSLDTDLFATDLSSQATQQQLTNEVQLARSLGIQGFPSLILKIHNHHSASNQLINIDYQHPEVILQQIVDA